MVNDEQQYEDIDASSYNISGDSSSPVEESPQQTTESAQNSTENGEISNEQVDPQSERGDEPEEYEFEVDGKIYSMEDIINWKKDADNKSEWNKSNTQKAQSLSQLNKLFGTMKGDENFRTYIKDYFFENPDGLKDSGFEDIKWDGVDFESPESSEAPPVDNGLAERVEQLETDKNVQILESQLDLLERKYPDLLGDARTDQFLKFVDESGVGDLEVGFRLWATDALLEQRSQNRALEENRQRNSGRRIVSQEQGAKSVVENTPQRGPGVKAYNSMTLDDPDISKYFDN